MAVYLTIHRLHLVLHKTILQVNGLIVITINAFDLPQKGVINITKTDGYHFVLKYSFYLYFYKNILLIISFDFSLLIEAAFKFIAYNNACKSS